MLADAFRSELFRFLKNRTAVFWSLIFLPIASVVFGALGVVGLKSQQDKLLAGEQVPPALQALSADTPINLAQSLVEAAADAGAKATNPWVLLFASVAAAVIYAGDYRWETWRLISARNSRPSLLLGKVATLAAFALAAVGLLVVAGLIEDVIRAGVFERGLVFDPSFTLLGDAAGLFGLSWLRIVQFTMMGLLVAVVTRSLLATLFVPLIVGIAQAFTVTFVGLLGLDANDWLPLLVNPTRAADLIIDWIAPAAGQARIGGEVALRCGTSLILWLVGPLLAALAVFGRQDLSKE